MTIERIEIKNIRWPGRGEDPPEDFWEAEVHGAQRLTFLHELADAWNLRASITDEATVQIDQGPEAEFRVVADQLGTVLGFLKAIDEVPEWRRRVRAEDLLEDDREPY